MKGTDREKESQHACAKKGHAIVPMESGGKRAVCPGMCVEGRVPQNCVERAVDPCIMSQKGLCAPAFRGEGCVSPKFV